MSAPNIETIVSLAKAQRICLSRVGNLRRTWEAVGITARSESNSPITSNKAGGVGSSTNATTSKDLDSSIIQNRNVWKYSGHETTFSDPLVDCRNCKGRFRLDKLQDVVCPKHPSVHPGEDKECDLTEAREFNLMFKTTVGAVSSDEDEIGSRLSQTGNGAGNFYQFRKCFKYFAPQIAVRYRSDRKSVSQRSYARKFYFSHTRIRADGNGIFLPTGRRSRDSSGIY